MKLAFINGILLDGSIQMEAIKNKTILVEEDTIVKIGENLNTEGYEVIDLKGQYIMPGLINLHVHLPGSGKPKSKNQDTKKLVKLVLMNNLTKKIGMMICRSAAKMQVNSGVTTLRSVGGVANFDTLVRDEIKNGQFVGPRILASNMAVSVPDGHMAGSLAYEAHNAEEAAHFTEEIIKDNPDLIKLMITGGVLDAKVKGEPGELKMMPELVKAASDVAHKHGLKVAAHVESYEGVKVALENGVDTIEHGAKLDPELIQLFIRKGAACVTTLSPALPYALFDPSVSGASEMEQYNGQIVFEGIIECAKKCLENGIPVGLGTDTGCPYITHYDMWREVYYFQKYCNVTNAFALFTATKRNAEIIGIDHLTGSIEEGKKADLLIVKDNPLDDLKALRNPSMVCANGHLIKNPHNKKVPVVEQELDKFL